MLSVGVVFIFIAGIAFVGFVINALFDRFRVTSILPLMLIGLLLGPVLKLINTTAQSTIVQLAPYVAAVAISFVIFDVSINIKFKSLGAVLSKATQFTLLVQVTMGLMMAIIVHLAFGWSALISLIFGFAASGPSSIITPTFIRRLGIGEKVKTTLTYESVFSDILQLVVPLTLLGIFPSAGASLSLGALGAEVFTVLVGAVLLGGASAFFWLYVLNRFGDYSRGYSWMLTITMIIATYGISQQLGLSSTIAVFVFGLIFANVGFAPAPELQKSDDAVGLFVSRHFAIKQDVEHTVAYQKEVVFFVSTFFFVYIGLIFNIYALTYFAVAVALLMVLLMLPVRGAFIPMLRSMFAKDEEGRRTEKSLVFFNVPRGLSPVIIGSVLAGYGFVVTGFTDLIFLVVLLTNIAFSVGIMYTYRPSAVKSAGDSGKGQKQQPQRSERNGAKENA